MQLRVGRPGTLVVAAGLIGIGAPAAFAQQAVPAPVQSPPPTLDPNAPLAPLPDIGVAWPDLAAAPQDATEAKPEVAADTRYNYRLDGIDTIGGAALRSRFEGLSVLAANKGKEANAAQLDRRAREDSDLLVSLLRAEGYYDASVDTSIETGGARPVVVLAASPGPLYRFKDVTLAGVTAAGAKADDLTKAFGVKDGDPVNSDAIVAGQANLAATVGKEGFPFAKVAEPEIVVDHATHTATLAMDVTPGTARRFGKITTNANNGVFGARHVQDIARFKPGQPYDATKLDDLRRALIQTSLVSVAEVKPVPAADPAAVDIAVKLAPAPPRTIAGELGYGTGEGARLELSWTHRNLFPPEGGLTLRGVAGTREQLGSIVFRRNNFHDRDRVLTAQIAAAHTVRDAYDAKTFSLSGTLERQTNIFFQKTWTWSLGAELVASDERDVILSTGAPRRRTFFIGALPTSLTYDGTDDLLNPTRGFRLGGRLSPELSLQGAAFGYARTQLDASTYRPLGDRVVLAARTRLGTIIGAPRDAIAPSRRFYAGGGASVRGYGFQAIGPRDPNNDPIGGRSLTEFSIEARVKAFGNFGVVPFFDAGNIYTSPLPKFSGFQYGAGLGVRYYSNFGPIRLDVGTPLNPQKGDSRIAVYVSLGQAFLTRALRWLGIALAVVLAVFAIALVVVDTSIGHRFVAERIGAIRTANGLRFSVGRIDGSLYGRARLRDVRVYDTEGLVLSVPEASLDWAPLKWFGNTLDIAALDIPQATLAKWPRTRPTGKQGPILPDFDIHIGRLAVDRLTIGPRVTGAARYGRIRGQADIHDRRALIDLDLLVEGSDALRLKLDAAPDRDRFDIDVHARGTATGVLARVSGLHRPLALDVTGEGSWARWNGTARAQVAGAPVLDLALGNRAGSYTLSGTLAPARITTGKLQRLTAPRVLVNGAARFADRRLDGTLSLRSTAIAADATGVIDLGASAFRNVRLRARLLRPAALFPNMSGRNIELRAIIDGAFATARFDYRLAADRFAFDDTGFDQARAAGRGHWSKAPILLPVKFSAARVTGVGDVAGGILRNLMLDGVLRITPKLVLGDDLRLRSDKLTGRINLQLDLATGQYLVGINGALGRYLIPGLGVVDVKSVLRVVPGAGGRGTRVVGQGSAQMLRLDNAFFRSLAGGLPRITTGLERTPDGVLHFSNLVLTAPSIRLTGNGFRRRDGTFHFEGGGRQATYGPLTLKLDGKIDKPTLDLVFQRPNAAMGLSTVRAHLDPTPAGFAFTAQGGSRLGPFAAAGRILLPSGGQAAIVIDRLDVSGTRASGQLAIVDGGFAGELRVAGGGLSGPLLFRPVGGNQRIEAHLAARRAKLGPGIVVGQGRLDLAMLLDPAGTTIDATAVATGLRYGSVSLARLNATAKLRGGIGEVRANLAGSRGRAFDLQTVTQITDQGYRITAQGTVDRRPLQLVTPAVLTPDGDGWRLAPTKLTFAGGEAQVAGRFSAATTAIDATVARMPLTILDIGFPGLGLGGSASGKLSYATAGDAPPTGSVDMTIRGLTRSGLVLSSRPIDVGVAGLLTADKAALRAVMASGGATVGRMQALLRPLGSGGLAERLAGAGIFAQLRYSGPADTLWRLTGVELFDLSGPVAIGADVTGSVRRPTIRGVVQANGARIQSATTGTSLTNVQANGRFDGSKLVIDRFAADAGRGGRVAGTGTFDFAARNGVGLDLRMQADNAVLINRDDIGATVTGPLAFTSSGAGGTIAGDVVLNASRYRLGQATAATAVPRLNIREINLPGGGEEDEAPTVPWQLAITARAPNAVRVTGLGLTSEWSATLKLAGAPDNPAITGVAKLIRGDYEFSGREFELSRGVIRFAGEVPANPAIDITADANVTGLNASIRVTGVAQKPEIAFTSVPALPQDELLSRLLFGTSITNLSAPEALQLAAAVAALQNGGNGLNPINAVRRAAGLDRLRILPADPQTGQGTSIAAGKYVTRRLYAEIVTDGQGYSATQVEFQVTRWLSLLSSISTLGRQSANVRVSKDY